MTDHHELRLKLSPRTAKLRARPSSLIHTVNPHVHSYVFDTIPWEIGEWISESDHWLEIYHQSRVDYESRRLEELRSLLDSMGNPDDVIIMLFCDKYLPFFENWLLSCEANGIFVRNRTICFALNEAAAEKARSLGVKCFYLDPTIYFEGGHAGSFGDRKFGMTMVYKNAIIYDMLQLGVNVLFQDVDLIWFKDPLPWLQERASDFDIQIMYDGINRMHLPYFANTGFIYINNSEVNLAVFETALRNSGMILQTGSHQKPLNRIFAHFVLYNLLNIRVLPEDLFMNGHLFNLKNGINPRAGDWEEKAIVFHYSWTGTTSEKILKLNKFGFNYVGISD